jgi:hypothetical protein
MLDVNPTDESSDCRPRPFQPVTPGLPNSDQPGVLLQSASVAQTFFDQPLRWRVRQLGALPKKLNYYFLRSSLEPEDLENRLNFEEIAVHAPRNCRFDQDLKIELTVREDGTAFPRFLYHTGRDEKDTIAKNGQAFPLDVTTAAAQAAAKAYIGFDFGTSNSSVSFVESRGVTEYQRRVGESSWKELHELAYALPYPIADALLMYLAETVSKERRDVAARQAGEAMLATLCYSAIADYRWQRQTLAARDKSKVFGQITQRSAGPLWGTLRQLFVSQEFGKKAVFTFPIIELFVGEIFASVEEFVTFIAQAKHDKTGVGSMDLQTPLHALANICHKVFKRTQFGFFEAVQRARFSLSPTYRGQFRVAHGQPPFIRSCEVEFGKGTQAPPELMPYLLVLDAKVALPLSPMVVWWQNTKRPLFEHGDCHLFDTISRDATECSFKTVGRTDQLIIKSTDAELSTLLSQIAAERISDSEIEVISVDILGCEDDGD